MSGLQRRTPLTPGKPLRRTEFRAVPSPRTPGTVPEKRSEPPRGPLRAKPARMSPEERRARQNVTQRSGTRCEACGDGAPDWAHRVARSQGGLWVASNGLALCRREHEWSHRHPGAAQAVGWILKSWQNPLTEPVHLGGSWWLLDDEGGRRPA